MIALNKKTADRLLSDLNDGADEGRARKAVRSYRQAPNDTNRTSAITALAALGEERQRELRQVARA